MQCKKKINILFLLIFANVIGATGLILLKAYTGALIQIVFGIQTLMNYILERKKKDNTIGLIVFYIVLSIIVSLFAFSSYLDFIPLVSAVLHTVTIIQKKEKNIRLFNLSSLVLWIPYYICFSAWANLLTCLLILVSNIISIFRYDIKHKKSS